MILCEKNFFTNEKILSDEKKNVFTSEKIFSLVKKFFSDFFFIVDVFPIRFIHGKTGKI